MTTEEMKQFAEEPKRSCDPEDLMCQMQIMNYLEGMKNLLGSEKFRVRYPEFEGLSETVSERMQEQEATIKEAFERCGMAAPGEQEPAITEEEEK